MTAIWFWCYSQVPYDESAHLDLHLLCPGALSPPRPPLFTHRGIQRAETKLFDIPQSPCHATAGQAAPGVAQGPNKHSAELAGPAGRNGDECGYSGRATQESYEGHRVAP